MNFTNKKKNNNFQLRKLLELCNEVKKKKEETNVFIVFFSAPESSRLDQNNPNQSWPI